MKSKQQRARELCEQTGLPFHSCKNWIYGNADPESTFRNWSTDLSLQIMMLTRKPNQTFTLQEIADQTELTKEGVRHIESRAILKIKRKVLKIIDEYHASK